MDEPPSTSSSKRHVRPAKIGDSLEELVHDVLFENENDSDNSDIDPDYIIESEHASDTEEEGTADDPETRENTVEENEELEDESENEDNEMNTDQLPRATRDAQYYYGKQTKVMKKKNIPPFKWKKQIPVQNVRTRQHNIITHLPGLRPKALSLGNNPSVEAVWNLLFSEDILQEILKWTNNKIINLKIRYKKRNLSYVHDCDMLELKGFIGLLVYTAVFKSGEESVHSLFATDGTGREIFRCTMTKERFLFLLQALRFDDPSDREERKKDDKAAPISNVFQKFVNNCQELYTPGALLCVDEMLVPFRGRCSFKMYMPKKPNKYGIKVQCLTDARTHYLLNAYIYTGKGCDGKCLTEQERKNLLIPTQAVLTLAKPHLHSNRNITTDNWYSSVELSKELLKKGLTTVGTLKKNKNEVPAQFLPNKNREEKSSLYGFTEELTLLSYVPKQNKSVIMISSMHHGTEDDPESGKPEIISFYNQTKGGVDTVDQLCANYSSTRRSRRWPMKIFYTIVNVSAGVNGYILHQAYSSTPRLIRMDFMKELAKALVSPLMQQRVQKGFIGQELKLSIKRILRIEEEAVPHIEEVFENRKRCGFCPPRLGRKTKYPCKKCGKPICLECTRKLCAVCFKQNNE